MTVEIYKVLLASVKCPRCCRQYTENDFTMWGDAYGYELADAGFHYTLLGSCESCKLITSFKQLGIPQLNNMNEVESFVMKLWDVADTEVKSSGKITDGSL